MNKSAPKTAKRGPTPDTLKIEGDWKKDVKGALKKKRPEKGWPTDKPKKD